MGEEKKEEEEIKEVRKQEKKNGRQEEWERGANTERNLGDHDETRIKPDSRLAEWIPHLQERKLHFFVATLFREHVERLCRIRRLQSLCTVDWSHLPIRGSLLSFGRSHLTNGRECGVVNMD